MRFCPRGQKEWERTGLVLVFSLLLALPLYNYFIDHTLRVVGPSMMPTFQNCTWVFSAWEESTVERGGLVAIEVDIPNGRTEWWMKRVIGLPGDTIHIDAGEARIFLNGEPLNEPYLDPSLVNYVEGGTWIVPDGEIFVMGDNRSNSTDSRHVGTLKMERVRIIFGTYFLF